MVYRGHVRDGKVEIDGSASLPEGAEVELRLVGETRDCADHRPIEEILDEIAASIPESEWAKLPPDLTDNLDHYIYGTPKK